MPKLIVNNQSELKYRFSDLGYFCYSRFPVFQESVNGCLQIKSSIQGEAKVKENIFVRITKVLITLQFTFTRWQRCYKQAQLTPGVAEKRPASDASLAGNFAARVHYNNIHFSERLLEWAWRFVGRLGNMHIGLRRTDNQCDGQVLCISKDEVLRILFSVL